MAFIINENDYPQNYDWLPQEKQQAIVDLANNLYKRRSTMFLTCSQFNTSSEQRNALKRQFDSVCERERGMWDTCDALGIKFEYGWVGHRGMYFLATYNDALAQQAYYDDIARDAEGDVDEYISDGDDKNE